jgi:hypothetical protein
MIRFDAIAECEPGADANGAGDRRPPDHPTAAGNDGGDNLPPTIIVRRDGDAVRMAVEIDGGEIIVTLTRSNARALGAALTAAGGAGFFRTRT